MNTSKYGHDKFRKMFHLLGNEYRWTESRKDFGQCFQRLAKSDLLSNKNHWQKQKPGFFLKKLWHPSIAVVQISWATPILWAGLGDADAETGDGLGDGPGKRCGTDHKCGRFTNLLYFLINWVYLFYDCEKNARVLADAVPPEIISKPAAEKYWDHHHVND